MHFDRKNNGRGTPNFGPIVDALVVISGSEARGRAWYLTWLLPKNALCRCNMLGLFNTLCLACIPPLSLPKVGLDLILANCRPLLHPAVKLPLQHFHKPRPTGTSRNLKSGENGAEKHPCLMMSLIDWLWESVVAHQQLPTEPQTHDLTSRT